MSVHDVAAAWAMPKLLVHNLTAIVCPKFKVVDDVRGLQKIQGSRADTAPVEGRGVNTSKDTLKFRTKSFLWSSDKLGTKEGSYL